MLERSCGKFASSSTLGDGCVPEHAFSCFITRADTVENLRKLAIIPEKKLDALLKLVDVVVNDDGTMNVGRFLVKPIPRGRQIMGSMRGSMRGDGEK